MVTRGHQSRLFLLEDAKVLFQLLILTVHLVELLGARLDPSAQVGDHLDQTLDLLSNLEGTRSATGCHSRVALESRCHGLICLDEVVHGRLLQSVLGQTVDKIEHLQVIFL